jgi:hypothetical protein
MRAAGEIVLTDAEVDQLIADVGLMSQELQRISQNDEDSNRRTQAERWLSTLGRTIEYAVQVRDLYKRGR